MEAAMVESLYNNLLSPLSSFYKNNPLDERTMDAYIQNRFENYTPFPGKVSGKSSAKGNYTNHVGAMFEEYARFGMSSVSAVAKIKAADRKSSAFRYVTVYSQNGSAKVYRKHGRTVVTDFDGVYSMEDMMIVIEAKMSGGDRRYGRNLNTAREVFKDEKTLLFIGIGPSGTEGVKFVSDDMVRLSTPTFDKKLFKRKLREHMKLRLKR